MNACHRHWICVAALGLGASFVVGAQPAATASAPAPKASVPAAKASAPAAKASAPAAKASAAAPKAAAPNKPAGAKSLKVKVLFADAPGQSPKPVAGAAVRLHGSEQTFATNAAGVAEVFGVLEGKPQLTVLVVNASTCKLPVDPAGGSLTVVVPRRGQGECRIGP